MRQVRAKQLRRKVYKDRSSRARKYVRHSDGSIWNVGLRATYRSMKREV